MGHESDPNWIAGIFAADYGEFLRDAGQLDEAERSLERGVDLLRSHLGPDHDRTRLCRERLASVRSQMTASDDLQRAA
ncbi:MAG: hypothetical protein ACYTF9_12305 [Planctomycetota bacterium]|jgi:hypothetical protein